MSFTFILPVIHPESYQVSNYAHVEMILKRTLETLKRQSSNDVNVVVVCCKIPSWSEEIGENIFFIDVSDSEVFKPNPDSGNNVGLRRVDRGLKILLGMLYAKSKFKTNLFMRVDADDYVNTHLAEHSLKAFEKLSQRESFDGYILRKGLHVEVSITPNNDIQYGETYLVKDFDRSCGSCFIFKEATLTQKMLKIHSEIFDKANHWFFDAKGQSFTVPAEVSDWLYEVCQESFFEEWHLINILGRHIGLGKYMNFTPLTFMGAAKACGHGNHAGARRGGIHTDRAVCKLPTRFFESTFGVSKTSRSITNFLNLYMNISFLISSKQKRIKRYIGNT